MNKRTSIFYLFILGLVFTSCIKKEVTPLQDEGDTFIKIQEAPVNAIFFSPFTNIKSTDLFSIRKDANSSAELQTPNTIIITADPTLLTDYNNDNGTDFDLLPDSLYTVGNPNYSPNAGGYSVAFNAGDFARDFTINLNGAKWDLSKKYGIAFRITNSDGRPITDGRDKVIVLISIKNKYDGKYLLKGHHNRSPYNFAYETEMHMLTKSATQSQFYFVAAGSVGHPIGTGPDPINDISWYGAAIAPVLVFDPATDQVSSVFNAGGSTPIVMYTGAGAPVSRYDAGTKTIYAYFYYYTAAGQDFSNRGWNDTLTYLGPR